MEREDKKRGRAEEEEREDSGRNAKKQEVIGFDDFDFLKMSDSFGPLGVFDFPWLKENLVTESDDWKLDDVFSSSLIDTSLVAADINFSKDEQLYGEAPILVDSPGEKFENELWPLDDDQVDGYDCIWSSVLNQPLSSGSIKISDL